MFSDHFIELEGVLTPPAHANEAPPILSDYSIKSRYTVHELVLKVTLYSTGYFSRISREQGDISTIACRISRPL